MQYCSVIFSRKEMDQFLYFFPKYLQIMFCCGSTVLFVMLASLWLISGQYGIPKPWYFPFTSSYWCGTASSVEHNPDVLLDSSVNDGKMLFVLQLSLLKCNCCVTQPATIYTYQLFLRECGSNETV